jgi:hypothetical protein
MRLLKPEDFRRSFLLLAAVVFGSLTIQPASLFAIQSDAVLAWSLKVGDQLAVQCERSDEIVTVIDTRDRKLESLTVLGFDWEVQSVAENGDATIRQTISRIRFKSGTPGGEAKKTIDIDTAIEGKRYRGVSRDAMKLVEPLIGLEFNVVLSPQNKLVSFNVPDATQVALDKLSADAKLLRGITTVVKGVSMTLPAEAVVAKSKWNEAAEVPHQGGSFDREMKYEVANLTDTKADVAIEVQLKDTVPTGSTKTNAGSISGPIELLSLTGEGNMVFDLESGIVAECQLTTEIQTRVMYRTDAVTTTIKSVHKVNASRK